MPTLGGGNREEGERGLSQRVPLFSLLRQVGLRMGFDPPILNPRSISRILDATLKGVNISPPNEPVIGGASGKAAMLETSEIASSGFFESIRAKSPDGYIIGVGAGAIFSMINGFPKGEVPKGLVISDVKAQTLVLTELIRKTLLENPTADGFIANFLELSYETLQSKMDRTANKVYDKVLKKRFNKVLPVLRYPLPVLSRWKEDRNAILNNPADPITSILNHYGVFHRLAKEGNIAIRLVDFTNPVFIQAIKELPDFSTSTNIIYLSNIVDFITGFGRDFSRVDQLYNLRAYENPIQLPIFVDALVTQNLVLRSGNSCPVYSVEDFNRSL